MDNKKQRRGGDEKRINVSESYELDYWSKALSVTKEKLKEVVGKVGTSADAVRSYLNKK